MRCCRAYRAPSMTIRAHEACLLLVQANCWSCRMSTMAKLSTRVHFFAGEALRMCMFAMAKPGR